MGLLMHLVVAFYIHREIGSEIIRDAVGISIGIQRPQGAGVIVNANGQRDRPARAVGGIGGNAEPVAEFVAVA
jgi:hypothetical protein